MAEFGHAMETSPQMRNTSSGAAQHKGRHNRHKAAGKRQHTYRSQVREHAHGDADGGGESKSLQSFQHAAQSGG